ncbi:hypothetical protein CSOJ01_01946 [Colletotrichum sojae]|uniref:Protein NO VEIN C-terminal domain-containing protein n=1 Tax=Colletotrichum sojae TaxID=2175907 RepID=A0A8H6JSD8_9PEZI|nr:hypothetical protein CSOJ01_01946 [Colletotrichum sojae]
MTHRATFHAGDRRFVFHPTRGWVSPVECIWKSPSAFQTTTEMSKIYPALGGLFCGVLGIKDAGVVEVVQELEHLDKLPSDVQKPHLLKKDHQDTQRVPHPADTAQETLRSLTDDWYIADQPTLKKEFFGHVDILDFDVTEVEELEPLTKWLQLEKLCLSKAVTERKVVTGTSAYKPDWSRSLKRRADFISLLGELRGSDSAKSLPTMRVFQASGVQVWKKAGSTELLTGSGDISVEKKDGFVNIFLRHDPNETHIQADGELAAFFVQLCSVTKIEFVTLVPLILKASDDDIRALLEKRGIPCPCTVGSETCDDDATTRVTNESVLAIAARNGGPAQRVITPPPSQRHNSSGNDESPETVDEEKLERFKKVGLKGETMVDAFFKKRISDWDANRHWTSKLREQEGYRPFTENESQFSDFTYTDEHDHMLKVLQSRGIGCKEWAGQGITYHLEVKATVFGCDEAFSLSQSQMSMIMKYALSNPKAPKDVFILVRAYHVEREDRGFKLYMNPWWKIARGHLIMKGPCSIATATS